jgi:hypothetical protein
MQISLFTIMRHSTNAMSRVASGGLIPSWLPVLAYAAFVTGCVETPHNRSSPPIKQQLPAGSSSSTETSSGRIPPAEVQRIVRSNFDRYRPCYEEGLRRNPTLSGRVVVRFVIGTDGRVVKAQESLDPISNSAPEPRMPDDKVVACIVKTFDALVFPEPIGGVVTVVYPIMFSPGPPQLQETADDLRGVLRRLAPMHDNLDGQQVMMRALAVTVGLILGTSAPAVAQPQLYTAQPQSTDKSPARVPFRGTNITWDHAITAATFGIHRSNISNTNARYTQGLGLNLNYFLIEPDDKDGNDRGYSLRATSALGFDVEFTNNRITNRPHAPQFRDIPLALILDKDLWKSGAWDLTSAFNASFFLPTSHASRSQGIYFSVSPVSSARTANV